MPTLKDRFGLETDSGTDIKAGVWGMAGVLAPVVAQMDEGWPKWALFTIFCATMVAINYFTRGSAVLDQSGSIVPDVPVDEDIDLHEDLAGVLEKGRQFVGLPLVAVETRLPVGISQRGIDLIKNFEGFRAKAYRCPAGVLTIGYGHTAGVKKGMVITREQGEAMLRQDIKIYERRVRDALGDAKTTQNQWDAMVSFAYNCGPGNLRKSSFLRFHKAEKYQQAADALMLWVRGGGKVLMGLVRRRKAERELYESRS